MLMDTEKEVIVKYEGYNNVELLYAFEIKLLSASNRLL